MRTPNKRELERDSRNELIFPNPVPTNCQELLELMDDASAHAAIAGGAGAPTFDHGIRVFNQLKAHFDLHITHEIAGAHLGLKQATDNLRNATNILKVATWGLAIVTILLVGVEIWKIIIGHI